VVVAPGPDAAEQTVADLESLLGEGTALLYPQRESLPYEDRMSPTSRSAGCGSRRWRRC
jgi:hypothetical protein